MRKLQSIRRSVDFRNTKRDDMHMKYDERTSLTNHTENEDMRTTTNNNPI